jgi:hypothetical protein
MTDVHQRPRRGKATAPSGEIHGLPDPFSFRIYLRRLADDAAGLFAVWHPDLDVDERPRYLPSAEKLARDLKAWRDAIDAHEPIPESGPEPVDFTDGEEVGKWFAAVREQIADIAAAAEDITRRPDRRHLGRAAVRRILFGARDRLVWLLAEGERGAAHFDKKQR